MLLYYKHIYSIYFYSIILISSLSCCTLLTIWHQHFSLDLPTFFIFVCKFMKFFLPLFLLLLFPICLWIIYKKLNH